MIPKQKKQARKDKVIHKTSLHKTRDNKNKTREDKAGSQDKVR